MALLQTAVTTAGDANTVLTSANLDRIAEEELVRCTGIISIIASKLGEILAEVSNKEVKNIQIESAILDAAKAIDGALTHPDARGTWKPEKSARRSSHICGAECHKM